MALFAFRWNARKSRNSGGFNLERMTEHIKVQLKTHLLQQYPLAHPPTQYPYNQTH